MQRRSLLQGAAALPLLPRCRRHCRGARRAACGACVRAIRSGRAPRSGSELKRRRGRQSARGAAAVRRLRRRRPRRRLPRRCSRTSATRSISATSRRARRCPAGSDAWTPAAERLRAAGPPRGRRRRRRQLRAPPQPAAGRQGRRPQLPGHLQCRRLAPDLDPRDEPGRAARGVRRRRAVPGKVARGARGERRRGRHVDRSLPRRHHRAGRYVQGGGCTTVGVAGLIQSGGFGSFSKGFGTAASGLLEARGRHRRWPRAHRQRLHAIRTCSGRSRAAAAAASASSPASRCAPTNCRSSSAPPWGTIKAQLG